MQHQNNATEGAIQGYPVRVETIKIKKNKNGGDPLRTFQMLSKGRDGKKIKTSVRQTQVFYVCPISVVALHVTYLVTCFKLIDR